MTVEQDAGLELDDIQIGALRERPSPYVGTYLLLRIDDPAAGGPWRGGSCRWSTRGCRRPNRSWAPGSPWPSPTRV